MNLSKQKSTAVSGAGNEGFSVSRTIKAARGLLSQTAFALELGISQSNLSKYESGKVDPPADIIEKCVNRLMQQQPTRPPDASALAKRITSEFAHADATKVRLAVATLLDAVRLTVPIPRSNELG